MKTGIKIRLKQGLGSCHKIKGVTLVELIAFIVIVGVVAVVLVQTFGGTLRGTHMGKQMTQATALALARMEVIRGQREQLGFTTFDGTNYDPCKLSGWTAQACSTTTYSAGSFAVDSTAPASCGTDCKEVTVTVDSPYGDRVATLTAQFWDY